MTALTQGHHRHSHARARGQRLRRRERRILKREILRQYRAGVIVTDICKQVGIARATFYAWLARDPQFHTQYRQIVDAREAILQEEHERFMARFERERARYWQNLTDGALSRALSVMSRRRARE